MMTEVRRTVQGVNPHEYEALKNELATEEGFQVSDTGIDSFVAKQGNLITLLGDYNRNGNILTLVGKFSSWLGVDPQHVADQILLFLKRDDATDEINHRPIQTPQPPQVDNTLPEPPPEGEVPPPETEPPVEEVPPPEVEPPVATEPPPPVDSTAPVTPEQQPVEQTQEEGVPPPEPTTQSAPVPEVKKTQGVY